MSTPSAVRDEPVRAAPVDLLVVGAGIVGLAHAVEAHLRGLSVAVIDRDDHAVGASVRNFGHLCVTPQSGRALDYALLARDRWLTLGAKADVPVLESGTLVVARTAEEMDVLEEFAAVRGSDQVNLLDRRGVTSRLQAHDPAVVGGARLPLDLRTDPRRAVAAIAAWLVEEGVPIHWSTSALHFEPGVVRTSRGPMAAAKVVVAIGHDVDYLLPEVAASIGLRRCALQMLRVAAPGSIRVAPAILTGLSMLRYSGLSAMPAAARVRSAFADRQPHLLDVEMNLMFTQAANGDLIVGDTHATATTHDPFEDEAVAELILNETARLLGVSALTVRERWRGTYATSSETDFLVHAPDDHTRIVSVTSGIGMTTSHGLAMDVLDQLT